MTSIIEAVEDFEARAIKVLDDHAQRKPNDHDDFLDETGLDVFEQTWSKQGVRRAHINSIDLRDSRGLYILHSCIFPKYHNNSPIYGFDVIAGKAKVTGVFHDFSPTIDENHPLIEGFEESVRDFSPSKSRELPDWAKEIFSENAIATGTIKDVIELENILAIGLENMLIFLNECQDFNNNGSQESIKKAQDFYCDKQLENPRTPDSLKSLGLTDEQVQKYCCEILFPKEDNN